jgi:uncharacterized membrane protein HdeD (DUF308 family)
MKNPKNMALLAGSLMVLVGAIAITVPFFASVVIEMFLGWVLIAGGALLAVSSFHTRPLGGSFMRFLAGLLYLVVGLLLVLNPIKGVAVLTLLLAISFIVQGIIKLIGAWQVHPAKGWIWLMLSGAIALALGIIVWVQWPFDALWVAGLLFGINILFAGWSLIMLGLSEDKIV